MGNALRIWSRIGRLVMGSGLVAVAVAYARIGWHVIFEIRIGPTVASITGTHGIHSGDMFGLASFLMAMVAGALGVAVLSGARVPGLHRRPRALAHRDGSEVVALRPVAAEPVLTPRLLAA